MALEKADPLKRKKKIRRKNLKENNIPYDFHEIVWEDIVGDSTIVSLEDFCKMKTAMISSFAYILKQDKKYIYTFSSYSDDGYFGDRNIIPIGCVKSMRKIPLK